MAEEKKDKVIVKVDVTDMFVNIGNASLAIVMKTTPAHVRNSKARGAKEIKERTEYHPVIKSVEEAVSFFRAAVTVAGDNGVTLAAKILDPWFKGATDDAIVMTDKGPEWNEGKYAEELVSIRRSRAAGESLDDLRSAQAELFTVLVDLYQLREDFEEGTKFDHNGDIVTTTFDAAKWAEWSKKIGYELTDIEQFVNYRTQMLEYRKTIEAQIADKSAAAEQARRTKEANKAAKANKDLVHAA